MISRAAASYYLTHFLFALEYSLAALVAVVFTPR